MRKRGAFYFRRRKRCFVHRLRFRTDFCHSWDNFIPNSPPHTAIQQLHQGRALHGRQQPVNCWDYQRTPQTPGTTGRSPPAAERQQEDQKSNVPGTNRVRSYWAQASSRPLHAPVGLEIPSCTAAPTHLSSLHCKESKGAFNTLSLQGTDRRW